jgi:hypothetical protein
MCKALSIWCEISVRTREGIRWSSVTLSMVCITRTHSFGSYLGLNIVSTIFVGFIEVPELSLGDFPNVMILKRGENLCCASSD